MILGKRRTVAVLAATAIVASGAMWAPAAAQLEPVCVDVPGGTIGATIGVGPVENVRIPAISRIRLCGEGPSAPTFRVEYSGGSCLHNCYTVYVGGGSASVGRLHVSWAEDGVGKELVVEPSDVALPGEQCLLSVGAPAAPHPECFIDVGVDQVPDVAKTIDDAVTLAVGAIEEAVRLTCINVPDLYDRQTGQYVDFCTSPTGWTAVAARDAVDLTCGAIPPAYDDWGYGWRFCDNPDQWLNAVVDDTYETCDWVVGPQWDDQRWGYVYFCSEPIAWTAALIRNFCSSGLCDLPSVQELIAEVRRVSNEEIRIYVGHT